MLGAGLSLAAATALPAAPAKPPRPIRYIDGLSFLPENLDIVADAGIEAMICDISDIEEVKDAAGVPRYLRSWKVNRPAIAKAAARIAERKDMFVAGKGSEIGARPGCAIYFQIQGCEVIDDKLERIAELHGLGLRVLQFTHHGNNLIAGGALEVKPSGLTPLGFEALAEMNRVGLLPDGSHGSDQTILDAATRSKTPIVLSHGACRAIVDHPRCFSDASIKAVASRGGVIGIFMMSFWLTRGPVPTTEDYLRHLRHVIKIGGIEAVAIANDFPVTGHSNLLKLGNNNRLGVEEYLDWWRAMRKAGVAGFDWTPEHVVVPELNNIYRMRLIHRALERDRFKAAEIEKIMGGNWQRVLTDVLG